MLDTARRAPFVAGVVGWTEFSAPDAPEAVARLAADPLLVGLRPMVQDIPDDDWLVRQDLAPAFRALVAARARLRRARASPPPVAPPRPPRPPSRPARRGRSRGEARDPPSPPRSLAGRHGGGRGAAEHGVQAVGPRHRGRPGLERREPAALRRPPPRGVRPGAPPVGQRLAGREPRGRLRPLARGGAGAPRRPPGAGARRDPRRQRASGSTSRRGGAGTGPDRPAIYQPGGTRLRSGRRARMVAAQSGGAVMYFRDPGITLDRRFARLVNSNARLERLYEGCRWAEGPAYFPAGRYLVWSDIPNDRMLRYDETSGAVERLPPPGGLFERQHRRPRGPARHLRARQPARQPHRARRHASR